MNLLLYGITDAYIVNGDTLMRPKFFNEGKRFHIVIANPPWNQDGYNKDNLKEAELKQRLSMVIFLAVQQIGSGYSI